MESVEALIRAIKLFAGGVVLVLSWIYSAILFFVVLNYCCVLHV